MDRAFFLLEADELAARRQTERAVGFAVDRYEEVSAARADQIFPVGRRFFRYPAQVHERRVPHVYRRGPCQQARREAVVAGYGPVDFAAFAFFRRAQFIGDAPFEIAVRVAAEYHDFLRRQVFAAQLLDCIRAVVFLEPFRKGHRPEQPRDLLAAFLFGYRREVVVLHRLHVFAAAAGVQVGYDFVPGFGGFFLPRVGGLVVYPAQDGRRYDEQNQDE